MFIAIKLAKAGFFGGSPQAVLEARADIVQNIINYEMFENDYLNEESALNAPDE